MSSPSPELLLASHLKTLKLPTFLREHDKLARQCAAEGADHVRYLARLVELELIDRERRMVERRIKAAKFPAAKSLDSFHFAAIPKLNKMQVLELARCDWINRRENVIALGPSGTGKTHVAIGLGLAACQKGLTVGFATASALVSAMMEARDERRLLRLQRYIVTRNEAEAKKDKADRQAIIDGLQTQLKKGDKALVGNSAYRRYLKASGKSFEIDLGKLADEARFDGISVLRTNARITPLQAVIRYRDLLQVEALFRMAKASFDTRPIFHQSDAAIRGHVFVSFLALTLAKELTRLCQDKGFQPEWQPLLNDLDRLQQATIEKDGKVISTRTHVTGEVGNVFKAAGIALPTNITEQAAT